VTRFISPSVSSGVADSDAGVVILGQQLKPKETGFRWKNGVVLRKRFFVCRVWSILCVWSESDGHDEGGTALSGCLEW
jgi:hypothetical protein